jgi:hypothetical protein
MAYIEEDLELFPSTPINVIKFDDPSEHGLTSFDMKAVDFILEYQDKYVFLELKDPDSPQARTGGVRRFMTDYQTGALKTKLSKKYRDTFIYRWHRTK